jgi:hypothetical protein
MDGAGALTDHFERHGTRTTEHDPLQQWQPTPYIE